MAIRNREFLKQLLVIVLIGIATFSLAQFDQKFGSKNDGYDEPQHLDYVLKLSSFEIPHWGSQLDQPALAVWECSRSKHPPGACDDKIRNPEDFHASGYNFEAQQPPLGYVAYLPGAAVVTLDGDPMQFRDQMRDAGASVSIFIASMLLLVVSRINRLKLVETTVMAAVVMFAPISVHAFSTISNDAACLLAGLVYLAGASYVEKYPGARATKVVFLGALVGLVLALTKSFLILIPAISLVALALTTLNLRDGSLKDVFHRLWRSRLAHFGITAFAVSTVVTGVFSVYQKIRTTVESSIVLEEFLRFGGRVDHVSVKNTMASVVNMFSPWADSIPTIYPRTELWDIVNAIALAIFVIGFALLLLLRQQERPLELHSYVFWLIGSVTFAVAWNVLMYVLGEFNFAASPRYGTGLIPFFGLTLALAISRIRNTWASSR